MTIVEVVVERGKVPSTFVESGETPDSEEEDLLEFPPVVVMYRVPGQRRRRTHSFNRDTSLYRAD